MGQKNREEKLDDVMEQYKVIRECLMGLYDIVGGGTTGEGEFLQKVYSKIVKKGRLYGSITSEKKISYQ